MGSFRRIFSRLSIALQRHTLKERTPHFSPLGKRIKMQQAFIAFAARKFGSIENNYYLCPQNMCYSMDKTQMINHIKQTAANVLPKGSTLYLYGSRARGDYHDDSDWDLLILLDKPKLAHEDFDKYSYPFVLMGWDLGADIRPHAYTKDEWFNGPHAMFYYNVEEDKEVLYES